MISASNARFLAEAVGAASAIAAGGHLRIFDALAAGPLTAADLAARCGLVESAAGRLLRALASIGVLDREDRRYRLAVDSYLADSHGALWERLPEVVRGQLSTGFDDASIAAGAYPSLVGFIGALAGQAARRAAMHLAPGMPDGARVLDVGAGSAVWSLALVAQRPSFQVTAFDLPPVLSATRRAVEDAGRTDCYRFLAGDALVDGLGGTYDLALVANVVHLFGEEGEVELLTRVAAALRPDGRLALIDVMPNDARPSQHAALHDLSLLLRTRDGALHPFSSHAMWLRRAGLEPIARHRLDTDWEVTLVPASRAAPRDGGHPSGRSDE